MSIIVEDGTVVANANSYVSVATANAYFANRNNLVWANLDPTDQQAPFLISAVDYMQQMYRMRWYGWRVQVAQVLDWPRLWVQQFDAPGNYGPAPYYFAPNVVPQEVQTAQMMLAVRIANGDLSPDVSREDMANLVKVGSLQVEYNPNSPVSTIFRAVDNLLSPLLINAGSSMMSKVSRT
jgi:hypothetical protein